VTSFQRVFAGLLFAAALPVAAQVPPVIPAFPNDLGCTPGELLYRQVGLDRVTNVIYHNQVLYTNNVAGNARREWRFTDTSDPTSLTLISEDQIPVIMDQGNHSHTKSGDWIMSRWGGRLKRQSPGVNIEEQMPNEERFWLVQDSPAGGSLHNIYWPWSLPFNWLQYGATPGQGRLWRADELLAEWEPLAEDGVAGNGILIGNLLLMVSDASMLGVVTYDIGPTFNDPPEPPRVLDKLSGPFGAYIGSVWENYLVLAGGEPRDLVYVVDYSDPTDLRLVTTMDLSGDDDLNAGTNVPYVQTQDQYLFTRRHKIDMTTLTPVLELDEVGDHRPAGSVSGPLDVSQYTLPIGNLLISGSYSSSGRDGVGVWCHAASPDRNAPYVGYHIPRADQTGYPLGAPISLLIHEELESFTIINGETVIVRPVGGEAIDAWISFAHDGILTITPKQYLEPDTTYEVVVVQDGIRDVANNGIAGYSFTFSTGADVNGGNRAPAIDAFSAGPSPAETGQTVTISATASDPENDPIEYRFSFGDGTPYTAWSSANQFQHSYFVEGHFEAKVQVRDLKPDGTRSTVTETQTVTVANVPAGPLPTHSSTIALDEAGRRLWVVDPDHGSVSRINADTGALLGQTDLDRFNDESSRPMSVAVAPNGEAWVALSGSDEVVVVNASGAIVERIDTGFGSAPQAVAIQRDGGKVFVSTRGGASSEPGHGRLLRFDRAGRSLDGAVELGPSVGALAVTGDGSRVFVARFLSAKDYGQVWEVDGNALALTRTLDLWRDRGRRSIDSGGSDGPGVPNHIAALTLSPQQDWLWYAGIKMDTNRGLFFDQGAGTNLPLAHDSTVRAVFGRFDLNDPSGEPREPGRGSDGPDRGRIDVDNSDSPSALVFSPRGDYVFATLQGNNALAALDDLQIRAGSGRTTLWRVTTGGAPRGLVFDPVTDSRSGCTTSPAATVSRVDVGGFLATGDRSPCRTPAIRASPANRWPATC
jgi:DNA-binding beta-propeller fold protein YncE